MKAERLGEILDRVAANGSVAVGATRNPTFFEPVPFAAFRWAGPDSLIEELPNFVADAGFTKSSAEGVSSDGSLVAGSALNVVGVDSAINAVRWDALGIATLSGLLPENRHDAFGISSNGTWISGTLLNGSPFVWSQVGGPITVNKPPATDWCWGYDVSNDGQLVVGACFSGDSPGTPITGFVWTPQAGTRTAAAYATDVGANAAGWQLLSVEAVSADGRTIVGWGINPSGRREAWALRTTDGAPACPADLDNGTGTGTPDGGVDISDLLYFLAAFESGSLAADLDNDGDPTTGNPDGGVDINDLLFFLARFEGGC